MVFRVCDGVIVVFMNKNKSANPWEFIKNYRRSLATSKVLKADQPFWVIFRYMTSFRRSFFMCGLAFSVRVFG